MRGLNMMWNQKFAKFVVGGLSAILVAVVAAAPLAWAGPNGTMAPMDGPAPSNERAANAPFLVNGKTMHLESFKGQPVMVWQVATWCGSCAVALKTMAQNRALIDASKLKVIVLRDYENGGYPGDDMGKFVAANAPALLHDPHFIIGEDTEELFKLYNPHHYVDVYHLIGSNGQIAAISSAPSRTFDKIKQFIEAEGKS
jgi:thiol-disulfide isomerase/thioredoxin